MNKLYWQTHPGNMENVLKYNCCTLSDYNYLLKGLVLYDSLEKHTKEDFILYYLCLDDKTFNTIIKLGLKYIIPINLKEIEYKNTELQNIKRQVSYQNYCFTLSSYFCYYLLDNCDKENILYIDSDIIFYDSLTRIFDTVKNDNIGIIRHRHVPYGHWVGAYNVGIVYFSKEGLKCCEFWKNLMLNLNNEYAKEYGRVGDQKYLELFEQKFNKVKIIDSEIHYGAPYNFLLYLYKDFTIDSKLIEWENKKDNLIFTHFIKFKPDFDNNEFQATETIQEEQKLFKISQIKELYNEYFQLNKECLKKYLTI